MNSDAILRQLNRLANDRQLTQQQRNIIHATIQHIRKQDDEMLTLKEDITDMTMPEDADDIVRDLDGPGSHADDPGK